MVTSYHVLLRDCGHFEMAVVMFEFVQHHTVCEACNSYCHYYGGISEYKRARNVLHFKIYKRQGQGNQPYTGNCA